MEPRTAVQRDSCRVPVTRLALPRRWMHPSGSCGRRWLPLDVAGPKELRCSPKAQGQPETGGVQERGKAVPCLTSAYTSGAVKDSSPKAAALAQGDGQAAVGVRCQAGKTPASGPRYSPAVGHLQPRDSRMKYETITALGRRLCCHALG